jgi:hypothetical protein
VSMNSVSRANFTIYPIELVGSGGRSLTYVVDVQSIAGITATRT